jgi:hypothetical protein
MSAENLSYTPSRTLDQFHTYVQHVIHTLRLGSVSVTAQPPASRPAQENHMKRAFIALAASTLFVGCVHEERRLPPGSMAPDKSAAVAASAAKPSDSATAAAIKLPAVGKYFEVSKKGKIYVFGNDDSTSAFLSAHTPPTNAIEKPNFGPSGETVIFETGNGIEAGLMAEFSKNHPKK